MTRLTFSAERNALNFELPKSWSELDQSELKLVLQEQAAAREPWHTKTKLVLLLTGLRVLHTEGDRHRYYCEAPTGSGKVQCYITDDTMAALADGLTWIDEPGIVPVCMHEMQGARAIDAKMHDVAFDTYLQAENCFQGILLNKSEAAVTALAKLLYPGLKNKPEAWEQMMVVQWWSQVKGMFADLFPHFFRPTEGSAASSMMEVMNNQIRALTGGDVTKESEILAIDTWRALTELDAKAREAEEFNRKMKKK